MSGFSLTLTAPQGDRDTLIADLWEAGTTGITEEDHWVRAFFDADADAEALQNRFAAYQPHYEPQDDHDWVRHAQSMWQAFPVGERFWLAPEWENDPVVPDGRILLRLRPGLACGSGSHPGTRLCLEALERKVQPGSRVLDVGTGSGILSEAAARLGAALVVACDVDHEATVVAQGNLPPGIALFTGSAASLRDTAFDIVVANLDAPTINSIADELARVARGTIILSGFRESEGWPQLPRPAREVSELDDWSCVVC